MVSTRTVAAAGGVLALVSALAAGTASAEPTSPPADTSIVSLGAQVTQTVADEFQAQFSGYFNYDATGTSPITPKVGCTAITRPNGSSAGIVALGQNARPSGDTADYCIDLATSSRVPSATDPTGLAFVPFAGDAVSWTAEKTTNAPTSLTTADLGAIYSCNSALIGGSGGPVTWNEIGGTSTDAVVPVIPQSSSGTRSFFLSEIGVTTLGTCVVPTDNSVEQDLGTQTIFSSSSPYKTADIVFPYSVANYLNQLEHDGNGSASGDSGQEGPLVLHSVNGIAATSGKSPTAVINKKFPYQRQIFFVTRDTTKKLKYVPTYLQSFLGADSSKGFICGATAQADVTSQGFLTIKKCGSIALTT